MSLSPGASTEEVTSHQRLARACSLLEQWIARVVDAAKVAAFHERLAAIADASDENALVKALGLAPRLLGKSDVPLVPDDREQANAVRPGWDPTGLSADQAARIAFLLASYRGDPEAFARSIDRLCQMADVGELIAIYRGFAIFPAPERLRPRAGEGVRSAIRPVFEAIAHRNPYPRDFFDDAAWNHMVLKALFIESRLAPIQGLDARANADLAIMLRDYAHERWAAGRPVSPELWRCVGPFARGQALVDLEHALTTGDGPQRAAAALALSASPDPAARSLLAAWPDLGQAIAEGRVTWDRLAI
jgi:hypothetical protein